MTNSIFLLKCRNIGIRHIKINCTYVNLDLFLLFLCTGIISWPFYTVLRLVVCSVLFSYMVGRKEGDCMRSELISLTRITEPPLAPVDTIGKQREQETVSHPECE